MTTFRVPLEAVGNKALQNPERLDAYVRLCRTVAQRAGIYQARGIPMDLASGMWVLSHEDLAALWECSKDAARRTVAAFEKAGLIERGPAETVALAGEAVPMGTLYRVLGAERVRGE